MFKPDVPIKKSSDDLLGRSTFAISFAEAILNYSETESIVTGLYGKWGAGKSSVVNMCIEHINTRSKEAQSTLKPVVIEFNPWNFSDQNQLISQFFIQLSTGLTRTHKGDDAIRIANQLEVYSNFFLPLSLIPDPVVGPFALIISKVLGRTGKAAKKWGELNKMNFEATRKDLDKYLKNLGHKIIIFIDDIDRLNSTEIRQIFQLVKLLGDFPNTIYVLSLDVEIVIGALKEVQAGIGEEYLEKIVQIPFQLPLTDTESVYRYLTGSIDKILDGIPEESWDKLYWSNIFHSGFKYFFTNLRDVTRFINVLRFGLMPIKQDVNAIDFIALTAIQVFEPDVYKSIASNKDFFSGLFNEFNNGEIQHVSAREKCDSIIAQGKRLDPEKLKEYLLRIFPKLEKIYNNKSYAGGVLSYWKRERKACSPDKFDIYFKLCLPAGDFSESEIKAIFNMASDPLSFASTIIKLRDENRIERFLNRIYDFLDTGIPTEHILNVVHVLLDLCDTFPDEENFPSFGPSLHVSDVLSRLITRVDSQEARYQIISHAFDQAENSLYAPITFLYVLGRNHGKWGVDNQDQLEPEDRRYVSARRLNELEVLVLNKIRGWAKSGKLTNHSNLLRILYRWKDLSDSFDEPNAFVAGITTNAEEITRLICSFAGKTYSHSFTDYVAVENIRIDMKSFEAFSNPEHLTNVVRPLLEGNPSNLMAAQVNILRAFIDVYDKKVDRDE
ncbi:MAG: P-loop NTPase fold protein [Pseudomonadota bacterium]